MSELSNIRATRSRRFVGVLSWLAAPLRPFLAVLLPDRYLGREVRAGRYGAPLLAAMLCAGLAALALGTRLDVGPAVRAMDAASESAGELKTDREIDEEIAKLTAVTHVKLGVDAVLITPLAIFALALALSLLARYIGGKPTMPRVMTVAALAAIPGAVRSLVTAVVAWRRPQVFPDELGALVKSPATLGIDVFTGWAVVIVAIGMCTAAELKPRKSVIAVAIGFALYVVVTRIILGGAR